MHRGEYKKSATLDISAYEHSHGSLQPNTPAPPMSKSSSTSIPHLLPLPCVIGAGADTRETWLDAYVLYRFAHECALSQFNDDGASDLMIFHNDDGASDLMIFHKNPKNPDIHQPTANNDLRALFRNAARNACPRQLQ